MSLATLIQVLLGRPRLILVYPLVVAIAALAATYLMTPLYTASVAFVPERLSSSGVPSSLAGLAGTFGINILTDVGRPPAFYVGVLDSRQLKEEVLTARFADPRAGSGGSGARDSVRLIDLLGVQGRTRAESLAAGVGRLRTMVAAVVDSRSGIIRVSAETRYPDLSAAVATHFVASLNRFNTTQRQSQAGERRKFIETRIAGAERGVRDAEESLKRFYQQNAGWSRSPVLVAEGARLRTAIDEARDVQMTLQREYELARIEEVNETPVLTVVDSAVAPVKRSRPQRNRIFLGVFLVGVLVGGLVALVSDYATRALAENPQAFAGLSRVWRPWRR
jgi:uncharacterized protein involved in exopolysaccharide biosynthesis